MIIPKAVKNSIYSYIVGDALGVPYEFRVQGTFQCKGYIGGGTYSKPQGTWSDDTTILLSVLDALTNGANLDEQIEKYKSNLRSFCSQGGFTSDNELFDIGAQTLKAVCENFNSPQSDRMGNGALFYSLPLAIYLLHEEDEEQRQLYSKSFVQLTHNNTQCFDYSFRYQEIIRAKLLGKIENINVVGYTNSGDVINTYNLVLDMYKTLFKNDTLTLCQKICYVVNLGNDTDTNAAFVGSLLGIDEELSKEDIKPLRNKKLINQVVNAFIRKVEKFG